MKTAIKLTFGTMLVAAVVAPVQADYGSRFAVNGTLTYTEATNNGFNVGDSTPALVAPANTVNRAAQFIDPDMELDYGLGFTYRMGDNSDTRFFFDWDRFDWGRSSAVAHTQNIGIAAFANVRNGTGWVDVDYDQFRFGLNHVLNFGDKLDVILNGFFDYTKIEKDLHEFAYDATANNNHYRHTHDEMSGWGPGFGAMARVTPFDACPQVGLFGGMNTTLLYADNEFYQHQNQADTNVYNLNPEDSNSMVAKFDAEFGIDYRRLFHTSWAPIQFQAALGLRYNNVVNAFKAGNTQLNTAGPVAAVTAGQAVTTGLPTDFGRFGPFLRFSIGGANS